MSHKPYWAEQARIRNERPVKVEKLDQQFAKNNANANSLANLKSSRIPTRTK